MTLSTGATSAGLSLMVACVTGRHQRQPSCRAPAPPPATPTFSCHPSCCIHSQRHLGQPTPPLAPGRAR
eukprot:9500387-Pyramimonas_sp.AAC.1